MNLFESIKKNLNEAANPENAEANELISKALRDKQFALNSKDELKKHGIDVDYDTYSDGSMGSVYLKGEKGRRLKVDPTNWRGGDFEVSRDDYERLDKYNAYNSKTGNYENLKKGLDTEYTLGTKSYRTSAANVKDAKEELPKLEKRLKLYAKRYGENSKEYRDLKRTIDSNKYTISKGIVPSVDSGKVSKDVDFKNYLNAPLRGDRPAEREKYTHWDHVSSNIVGQEKDPANATLDKYRDLKAQERANNRDRDYNAEQDAQELERIKVYADEHAKNKASRDARLAKNDAYVDAGLSDIDKRLKDFKDRNK